MSAIAANDLTNYLDQYLRISDFNESAINGLQVQGKEQVRKIGFAVDACMASFLAAMDANVDMLIVHHGLFWGHEQAITGSHFERIRVLIESGISLYAAHLPLDAHPEVGNNARLAQELGLEIDQYFGHYNGTPIAILGHSLKKIDAPTLKSNLQKIIGEHVRLDRFGPEDIHRIGICSGAGANLIPEAKSLGAEAFITGEPRQSYFHFAREEKIHVLYGRHYDTETIGLKTIAAHLAELFQLESQFFDIPTNI